MVNTIQSDSSRYCRRITLNNPGKHNCLGKQELDELHRILDEVEVDTETRVVLVTGAGEKTFCAGASLDDLQSGAIGGDDFQAVTDRLAVLPIPTIAVLNGNAFGGGVELALSCDFRIGALGIRAQVPAAKIGLCYPVNGIERFVARLGFTNTMRLLIATEQFDAAGLLEIGLLTETVDRPLLEPSAEKLVQHLASLAPLAVRSMKTIAQQSSNGTLDKTAAQKLATLCAESEDLQEGLLAKREKRPPIYRGR